MLLPALNAARERARAINCAANGKQIATANALYREDNDGLLLVSTGGCGVSWTYTLPDNKTTQTGDLYWTIAIWPYLNSLAVLDCPSSPFSWKGESYTGELDWGMNRWTGQGQGYLFPIFRYVNPSGVMMFADAQTTNAFNIGANAKTNKVLAARHSGEKGLNAAFADGHVEMVMFDAIPDPAGGTTSIDSRFWSPKYRGSNP